MNWRLENLTPERREELWPWLEPQINRALEESQGELTAQDIRVLHQLKGMTIFVEFRDEEPSLMCVLEFIEFPRYLTANVCVLAGSGIRDAKEHSWALIVERLRKMGVKCIDAWVSDRTAALLDRTLGFKKAYNHVRLPIGD